MLNQEFGIKLLTLATTIRWIGWGFVESLIPVFLLSFAQSYAETGLLRSVYDLVFLFSLPIIGALADKISAKKILVLSLLIYPFIGASYFLAGVTGMALFIVIARAFNGLAFALDETGRETYFRGHAGDGKVSGAFGYFDTITSFWWIVAVLFSLILIKFLTIQELFLFIIPTSILALLIIIFGLKPHSHKSFGDGLKEIASDGIYTGLIKEYKSWSKDIKFFSLMNFFLAIAGAAVYFFIPIHIYAESGDLAKVIVLGAVSALPGLLGYPLGKFGDRNKNKAVVAGLSAIVILFVLFAMTQNYLFQLLIALGLGISLELIWLTITGLTTKMSSLGHYGKLSSAFSGIGTIGTIIGPIIIGFSIDRVGNSYTFVALGTAILLVLFFFLARILRTKKIPDLS